jgi:hypothetical protein
MELEAIYLKSALVDIGEQIITEGHNKQPATVV